MGKLFISIIFGNLNGFIIGGDIFVFSLVNSSLKWSLVDIKFVKWNDGIFFLVREYFYLFC